MLLSSTVAHTAVALKEIVERLGASPVVRSPGVVEVRSDSAAPLVAALASALSGPMSEEVRVVVLSGAEDDDQLLAAALQSVPLSEMAARVASPDVLGLLADESNAFRSVYQPIVALGAGGAAAGVVGYEALLRADGSDGPISPDRMFGAARKAGWSHVLDRIGRTTALEGASGWLGDAMLFVNFAPSTIYQPEVCLATTEQAAAAARLRLDQLVFEVTEAERVEDPDHLDHLFDHYRRRGCKVALDDLGEGYSSLNLLTRLRPDIVKLDKGLVHRIGEPAGRAVVGSVVSIAHSYGGQVLAECVETSAQAAAAARLGVDLAQGWRFSQPLERSELGGAPSC